MEERYTDSAPRAVRNRHENVATMVADQCVPLKDDGPNDMRKHELFMFAEEIVAQVKAKNIRGRERCFVNSAVNLLLDS